MKDDVSMYETVAGFKSLMLDLHRNYISIQLIYEKKIIKLSLRGEI